MNERMRDTLDADYFHYWYKKVNTFDYINHPYLKIKDIIQVIDEDSISVFPNIIEKLYQKGFCIVRFHPSLTYTDVSQWLNLIFDQKMLDTGTSTKYDTLIQFKKKGTYFANTCFGQPLHSDDAFVQISPRYLALFCVKAASKGGITTLAPLDDFLKKIIASLDSTEHLFSSQALSITSSKGKLTRPLFSFLEKGIVGCCFPSILQAVEAQKDTLEIFKTIMQFIHDPVNQIRFKLQPNEILLLDNFRVLHGRTPFGKKSKRTLIRAAFKTLQEKWKIK